MYKITATVLTGQRHMKLNKTLYSNSLRLKLSKIISDFRVKRTHVHKHSAKLQFQLSTYLH